MNIYQIIKRPVITERSNVLQEKENRYVFAVNPGANKYQVKEAVEKLYNVSVEDVRTMMVKGKLKRMGKFQGYRTGWKKAIVKLAPGQKIQVIEENK